MTIDSVLLELPSETTNINVVKGMIIARLLHDKIITEEQSEEYTHKWQMIIIKPNWFGKCIKFFKKENLNKYLYKYVKFEE